MEKKLSKKEMKKTLQYQEKRQRLINSGVNEDKVDAVIAQQDYASLPVERKMRLVESILTTAFKQIGEDIQALRHNDLMIADAMDLNMRAMSVCLTKASVSLDEQKRIIEEVQAEMAEAHQKLVEEQKKKTEEVEMAKLQEVLAKEATPAESAAPELPEGATIFGG